MFSPSLFHSETNSRHTVAIIHLTIFHYCMSVKCLLKASHEDISARQKRILKYAI